MGLAIAYRYRLLSWLSIPSGEISPRAPLLALGLTLLLVHVEIPCEFESIDNIRHLLLVIVVSEIIIAFLIQEGLTRVIAA